METSLSPSCSKPKKTIAVFFLQKPSDFNVASQTHQCRHLDVCVSRRPLHISQSSESERLTLKRLTGEVLIFSQETPSTTQSSPSALYTLSFSPVLRYFKCMSMLAAGVNGTKITFYQQKTLKFLAQS